MYDPSIARFLQEDTYRGKTNDPLSLNLYTYCINNPIRYYDPSGHTFVVIDELEAQIAELRERIAIQDEFQQDMSDLWWMEEDLVRTHEEKDAGIQTHNQLLAHKNAEESRAIEANLYDQILVMEEKIKELNGNKDSDKPQEDNSSHGDIDNINDMASDTKYIEKILDVSDYKQGDYSGNLGKSNLSISGFGCTLMSVAMVLGLEPMVLMEEMMNAGLDPSSIYWGKVAELYNKEYFYRSEEGSEEHPKNDYFDIYKEDLFNLFIIKTHRLYCKHQGIQEMVVNPNGILL